ncbi:MAG: hypothetical protein NXI27_20935 [Alphaproteobacteria bacterium]|nr:hypothetical protein [Alphaproteobacteria bacterium]
MKILQETIGILKNGGPTVWKVLIALLLIDMLLIGIYVALGMADIFLGFDKMPVFWTISEDFSAGEIFNYMKWIFMCGSLAVVFYRTRVALFASLSLVFALVFADDSFQIHERGGAFAVNTLGFNPAFGLRAQDFGELTVWAMLGTVALAALAIGFLKSPREFYRYGYFFVAILCGLVVTGMGFDMLNAWDGLDAETALNNSLTGLITIAEDGGEMIVGSVGCAGALAALLASRQAQPVHTYQSASGPTGLGFRG